MRTVPSLNFDFATCLADAMSDPYAFSFEDGKKSAYQTLGMSPDNGFQTVDLQNMDPLLLALAAARTAFAHTVSTNTPIYGNMTNSPPTEFATPYCARQTPLSLFTGNPFLPMHVDPAFEPMTLPTHPSPSTVSQSHVGYTVASQQSTQSTPHVRTPSPTRQPKASSQKRTMGQSDDGMQPPAKKRMVSLAVSQEAATPVKRSNSSYSHTSGSGSTTPIPDMETRPKMDAASSDEEEPGTKRNAHREVEKKRRDDLKTYLLQLQQLVPGLRTPGARTHHSKVTVVRCAVEHIFDLQARARSAENEMDALRREVAALRANQR